MAAATTTRFVDSHTGGEPTRVVVSGGPELGRGPMAARLQRFRDHHDAWRRALVNEPRGNGVIVGALLCEPPEPSHACGVIFFDNMGYLGMCGHGTIGVVATLAHLGRLRPATHRMQTAVGTVGATLHEDGAVTVANVSSYRHAHHVALDVPALGRVHGDVAWGGNWFFLCHDHGLRLSTQNLAALTEAAAAIRLALRQQGVQGAGGAEVDHIQLLGPAQNPEHDATRSGRGFVLCPGGAYDRSPCGTGTSARLACLAADGELAPGQLWHQESVIGSVFSAHYQRSPEGGVLPFFRGRAHVTLDATVVFDAADPYTWGRG